MNLSAGALAQSTSVPPAGRIWTNTSCLSGFTSASPAFASSDLSLSRVVTPRGRRSPRVTVIVNACDCMQQAGSSKSVRPLPSSSMQLPQISRGGSGLRVGRVVAPRGRGGARVTVVVEAGDCMQQAGSAEAVGAVAAASVEVPPGARGGGTGPAGGVVVVVEEAPGVVVVVGAG